MVTQAGKTPKSRWQVLIRALLLLFAAAAITVLFLIVIVARDLPGTAFLAGYRPPVSTKIHDTRGAFIAELAQQSRIFVPIERTPEQLRNAFIAKEDRFFYQHFGVNPLAISRAIIDNIPRILSGQRLLGASTITQQVAKNFIVGSRRTLVRKIREAIIALRLERQLSKNRILELYLNEIFLGGRAYGVGSAALRYFDKSVRELTLGEMAILASLPRAPNANDPRRYPEKMFGLRNATLEQMLKLDMISQRQYQAAIAEPVKTVARPALGDMRASYAVAEVSRQLTEVLGEDQTFGGGLSVRTSLDRDLQEYATRALRSGLMTYDRRHGYRGPLTRLSLDPVEDGQNLTAEAVALLVDSLNEQKDPEGLLAGWQLGVVVKSEPEAALISNRQGEVFRLRLDGLGWARRRLDARSFGELAESMLYGPPVTEVSQVVAAGDVIIFSADGDKAQLEQIPAIEGAIVALSPQSGRIFAMQGGWDFLKSQLNRSRQAKRQPGSAFKPFVYLTALEQGLSPSTRILDAPIVLESDDPFSVIKPSNYSQNYFGPSTLRLGIERSRNLMTLRLARVVGIDKIANVAERFAIVPEFPLELGNALGAEETTPLSLLTAYAVLANGGRAIVPTLIDQVQDRDGKQLYAADLRECQDCGDRSFRPDSLALPELRDNRTILTDPAYAFQITYLLEGVIKRGTGRIVQSYVDVPMAGKTGTTNNNIDTWFVGYTPNIAAAVYVGFDRQQPLGLSVNGTQETGASVAAPIFARFMQSAVKHFPNTPFAIPPNVSLVRIDYDTGALPTAESRNTIIEAFRKGTEPTTTRPQPVLGESGKQSPPVKNLRQPDNEIAPGELY